MKKNQLFKKVVIMFLMLSLFAPNIFLMMPEKGHAFWGFGDIVSDPGHTIKTVLNQAWKELKDHYDDVGKYVARLIARALVQMIVQDTVNWINSGFEGSPAYMTDPKSWAENSADKIVGEFILKGPLGFLCDPFQLQIKLNLGLKYGYGGEPFNCTMTGILGNVEGAYEDFVGGDFIGGGGWDSWMQMASNPENTPQGAYMMAEGALEMKIAASQEINDKEAAWNSGGLSLKKCEEKTTTYIPDAEAPGGQREEVVSSGHFTGHPGYKTGTTTNTVNSTDRYGNEYASQSIETVCETTTPGTVIMETLNLSETSWIRSLELGGVISDGINAIIGALATQLLKMTFEKLKEGIFDDEEENVDYMAQLNGEMAGAQNSLYNQERNIKTESEGSVNDEIGLANSQCSTVVTKADNAITKEQTNLENYVLASTTLGLGKSAFINAYPTCNINSSSHQLSVDLLRSIVDNIDGVDSAARNIPLVYFNLPYIRTSASSTAEKISRLNDIKTRSQESEADCTALESEATSVTANSTSTSNLNSEVRTWLNSARNSYASASCPIEISL